MFGAARIDGKETDVPKRMLDRWRKIIEETYWESEQFSVVRPGLVEADLRAEVKIIDRGKGNKALAFISGLTLLVLPVVGTDTFTVETTFRDAEGEEIGRFERSAEVNGWIGLILLPVMPFAWPPSVIRDTISQLNLAALREASESGLLACGTSLACKR